MEAQLESWMVEQQMNIEEPRRSKYPSPELYFPSLQSNANAKHQILLVFTSERHSAKRVNGWHLASSSHPSVFVK